MNNPNPFVPKGSLLDQQSQRRSRLKIAVFCVLAVSVTGLVLTLIEGCKREAPDASTMPPPVDTSTNPTPDLANNTPVDTNNTVPMPSMMASNTSVITAPTPPPMPPSAPPTPPAEPGPASTYAIASGDTLGKIAKANHVTLKALQAANPGVDSRKLKIGQKLNIPAASATPDAMAPAPGAGGGSASAGGGETYTVKSGDTVSRIAKHHGITQKALRAANPSIATTDHIKVGDKLTIPAATTSTSASTSAPVPDTTAPVTPPIPNPVPAPAPATPAPGH